MANMCGENKATTTVFVSVKALAYLQSFIVQYLPVGYWLKIVNFACALYTRI